MNRNGPKVLACEEQLADCVQTLRDIAALNGIAETLHAPRWAQVTLARLERGVRRGESAEARPDHADPASPNPERSSPDPEKPSVRVMPSSPVPPTDPPECEECGQPRHAGLCDLELAMKHRKERERRMIVLAGVVERLDALDALVPDRESPVAGRRRKVTLADLSPGLAEGDA